MSTFSVIMPAAGKSQRFRDKHYKKPFAVLDGRAVWLHSAEKFLNRDDVIQLILVIAPEDREDFDMKFSANVTILGIDVVEGGENEVTRWKKPYPGSKRKQTSSPSTMQHDRVLRMSGLRRSLKQPHEAGLPFLVSR